MQRQHDTGSDLDAALIPITIPELLRLLRGTVIYRPGKTAPGLIFPPERDHCSGSPVFALLACSGE
jgi:hypothetical protein